MTRDASTQNVEVGQTYLGWGRRWTVVRVWPVEGVVAIVDTDQHHRTMRLPLAQFKTMEMSDDVGGECPSMTRDASTQTVAPVAAGGDYRQIARRQLQQMSDQAVRFQFSVAVGGIHREEVIREMQRRGI